MKRLTIGVISILLACSAAFAQSGSVSIITSGGTALIPNPNGMTGGTFLESPSGSPATVSVTIQGCMGDGAAENCDTAADTNTTASATNRGVSFSKQYDHFKVAASWTGGASTPLYFIKYQLGALPAATSGSNVTVASPVDGSGYVNIDCKAGCSSGNANGQATMANSAPVVIASNQSALPVSGTFWQATQPVSGTFWQATQPVSGTFWQSTQPVSNAGTFAVQSAESGTWNVTVNTSLPAGANTIGAVTQASGPWTENQTQLNSVALGSPSNYGTSPGAVSVQGVNAFVTNTVPVSGTVTTTPPSNASTNIAQIAGSTVVADPCQVNARSSASINLTASGQIITGTAAKQTYLCFFQFALSSTADNVALVEGTGTTCATSTAGMAGGTTAATGWNLLANGSVTAGTIQNWAFKTATLADNVCLLASSGAQISGTVQYVQQ